MSAENKSKGVDKSKRETIRALRDAGAAIAATLTTGVVAADLIRAGEASIWAGRVSLLRKQVASLDECIARLRSELIAERRSKGGYSILVADENGEQKEFATFQDEEWLKDNGVIILAIRLSLPPKKKMTFRDNTTGWEEEIPMPTNDPQLEEQKLA